MRERKRELSGSYQPFDYRGVEEHLADMAAKAPHTPEELLAVNGVGRVKAQKYGRAFLEAIAAYEQGAAPQEVPQGREGRP